MKKLIIICLLFFTASDLFSQSLNFTLDEDFHNKNFEVGVTERITWESESVEKVTLEYSTDGGKSWKLIFDNYTAATGFFDWMVPNNASIFCKLKISESGNSTIVSLVPVRETSFFTIYGMDKWKSIESPTDKNLTSVKFSNKNNGIAWGNEILVKTSDGGKNWIVVSEFSGKEVEFVDQNHGWMINSSSDSNFVLRTQDGGKSWRKIFAQAKGGNDDHSYWLSSISFTDANNGLLARGFDGQYSSMGTFGYLSRTKDGGETWVPFNTSSDDDQANYEDGSYIHSVSFKSDNTYWYNDTYRDWNGTLIYNGYYSTKSFLGRTPYTDQYSYLSSFFLENDQGGWHSEGYTLEGWISGKYYKMNPLTNEWTLVYESSFKGIRNLHYYSSEVGWFWGTQYELKDWEVDKEHNVISMTKDGGLTWELQQFGAEEVFPQINDFFSLDGKTCWAVGNNGTILKYEMNAEQNNISAKLSLESPIDNSVINLASSSFKEGQNYFIEPITLEDPYKDLEKEANIFEGTRFSLDEGAIDEDIALDIRFKIMDPNIGNQQNINIPEIPFFMFWGIEVTGEQSGVTSFEDFYKFNDGKKAGICIPQTEQFMEVLKELEIDISEIDFAFLKGGEYITEGIEWELKSGAEGKPDSVCIYLDHFSQIVGGNNLVTSVEEKENNLPTNFGLEQNYPNPFNPTTTISYTIPSSVIASGAKQSSQISPSGRNDNIVTLKIFDVLGKEIKTLVNKHQQAGQYDVSFDASNLSSGIYYYQLKTGSFVETKKMILMK